MNESGILPPGVMPTAHATDLSNGTAGELSHRCRRGISRWIAATVKLLGAQSNSKEEMHPATMATLRLNPVTMNPA